MPHRILRNPGISQVLFKTREYRSGLTKGLLNSIKSGWFSSMINGLTKGLLAPLKGLSALIKNYWCY
jgi:hypothetical protein